MATLIASVFLTLDGVLEAPHIWHPRYMSAESLALVEDMLGQDRAMLLGRHTYEDFASYWPQQGSDVPLADATNAMRKYVVSSTLQDPQWTNTVVVGGDLETAVGEVQAKEPTLVVPGGAELIRGLLRAGLLDELRIVLDPIVYGTGLRLFGTEPDPIGLQLVSATPLPHGVTHLVYRPERRR